MDRSIVFFLRQNQTEKWHEAKANLKSKRKSKANFLSLFFYTDIKENKKKTKCTLTFVFIYLFIYLKFGTPVIPYYKVCTLILLPFFHFKSNVMAWRAQIIKIVVTV